MEYIMEKYLSLDSLSMYLNIILNLPYILLNVNIPSSMDS